MTNRSIKEKLLFSGRKFLISIKRNYYIIPLIYVFITCFQFMCSLYILSPNFNRINYGEFNCMFVFIIALFSILSSVAYLNYALKKFGQKRPLHMLIIYFVMEAVIIVLLFKIFEANNVNIAEELANYNEAVANKDEAAKIIALQYYEYGVNSYKQLMAQFVLLFTSLALVITAPLVQAGLNKLKFKRIEAVNEK